MDNDEKEIEQEQRQFRRIVSAFKTYKTHSLRKVEEKEKYLKTLPEFQQTLLCSYKNHLNDQKTCINQNAEIIKFIIKDVESMFENVTNEIGDCPNEVILASDFEKVQSTLRQVVRDWSTTGEQERKLCYDPIIKEIESRFPLDEGNLEDIQILVPGAGLGRLSYELAKRGYTCQGNEFSLYMLFASNFVLNKVRGIDSFTMCPWVHTGSNIMANKDQLKSIKFPDVEPSDLPPNSQFTMAAGDFIEIYTEEETWDCVATCFFIDCANNIVSFLETIYKILKPGGLLINLGPLLYHFADQCGENSIEPSYEVVKQIITGLGFKIVKEKVNVQTIYTQHDKSMLTHEYSSVFFVAQKPRFSNSSS